MSRIGKLPIAVPAGVAVTIGEGNAVAVKGPKGELKRILSDQMLIKEQNGQLTVERPNDKKANKALHGLTRTLLNNMVIGVTQGFSKVLEINGVGYRAAKSGSKLTLNLGYSQPVEMFDPEGVTASVDAKANTITITGIDKEKVGQYAADIRSKREPEPFKGKGIKYSYERIRRKVGKTGKK